MEAVFRDDPYARSCEATVTSADGNGVRLDRTVFYPTGGGQPGDSGVLRLTDGAELRVVTTVKGESEEDIVHILEEGASLPAVGTSLTATVDWERRYRHMRMHSCLHLLCSIVPGGVTGGQIGDGKGRLDFDLPDQTLDKEALTERLNALVEEDLPIGASWISDAELEANPELVRTMSVKPPSGSGSVRIIRIEGVDVQPCGGTHVRRTGEIGPVVVSRIEKKGRHNRRVNVAFAE